MGWESERDSEMGRSNNMRERERERWYSSSIKLIGPQ